MKFLSIIPLFLCSIICFGQSNLTNNSLEEQDFSECISQDTLYLPLGYTHALLPNLNVSKGTDLLYGSLCNKLSEAPCYEITKNPKQQGQLYYLDSLRFDYKIHRPDNQLDCSYQVQMEYGTPDEEWLSFSIPDTAVELGASFCVEVKTKNFNNIIAFVLNTYWDTTALEYVATSFPSTFENDIPQTGNKFNANIVGWISLNNFVNGYSLPDNSTVYSLCFRAKKPGQHVIDFGKKLGDNTGYVEIIDNQDNLLKSLFKGGKITVRDSVGCDAIETTTTARICEGESYVFNNQTYKEAGTYQATFIRTNGCDSIHTVALEVSPIIETTISAQICEGESYIFNNGNYQQTGTYQAQLTSRNGCDSIVNFQLEVLSAIEHSVSAQICTGETYFFNEENHSQSGTYSATYSATGGCDSIVNLHLEVLSSTETNVYAQICEGGNYIFNNENYQQSSSYQINLIGANGCDSIVYLHLDVLPSIETNVYAQICEGGNYIFNNENYQQSSSYQVNLTAANGCDSIVYLHLDVLPPMETNRSVQICTGDAYLFNGQTYSQSGQYQAILSTANGCDSIVNLELIVTENVNITTTATICEGGSYIFGNQTLTTAGEYQKFVTNTNGCDSTINLQLVVLSHQESAFSVQICADETYLFNNQSLNKSGIYHSNFTTENGCDSTVMLLLDVLKIPVALSDTFSTKTNTTFNFSVIDNDTLNGVNYEVQLIESPHIGKLDLQADGTFNYQPFPNYNGTTTFSYQLCNETCLPNGCTTTTVTLNIEGNPATINFPPIPSTNPLPNKVEVSRIQPISEGDLFIYNMWGQLVEQRYFSYDSQAQLWNLQNNELPAGIYFYVKRAAGQKEIIESGKIVAIGR